MYKTQSARDAKLYGYSIAETRRIEEETLATAQWCFDNGFHTIASHIMNAPLELNN